MAGPLALIIPLGLLLIGGAAAAAGAKKKKEAAPASPAAATATAAAQTAPPAGTPADIAGMIVAAVNSGNPTTMRAVANAIRAKYPAEAANLDTNADQIQKVTDQWGVATLPEAVAKEEAAKRQQAEAAAATAAAPAGIASGGGASGGAAAAGAAAGTITPAEAPAPGAAPAPPVTTPVPSAAQAASTPATAAQQLALPSDVQALILASMASNNPATMRRAADQIQAKHPLQANDLRTAATALEAAIQLQQSQAAAAAAAAPALAAPVAQAAQVLTQAAQIASQAGQPAGVPATTNVPSPAATAAPPQVAMPMPTPAAAPAIDPNRARAEALALKLKFAVKGKEDKKAVAEFQTVERLPRTDGSYGSETATALADRYSIVPPKPLYWGKKGGDYQTLVKDKQQYSAHLLVLAQNDPQRADEWRAAAKV